MTQTHHVHEYVVSYLVVSFLGVLGGVTGNFCIVPVPILGVAASFLGAPCTFGSLLSSYSYHTPLILLFSFLGAGLILFAMALENEGGGVDCVVEASDGATVEAGGGIELICSTEDPRLSMLRIIALQVCASWAWLPLKLWIWAVVVCRTSLTCSWDLNDVFDRAM